MEAPSVSDAARFARRRKVGGMPGVWEGRGVAVMEGPAGGVAGAVGVSPRREGVGSRGVGVVRALEGVRVREGERGGGGCEGAAGAEGVAE
jgi:hypothetical protein